MPVRRDSISARRISWERAGAGGLELGGVGEGRGAYVSTFESGYAAVGAFEIRDCHIDFSEFRYYFLVYPSISSVWQLQHERKERKGGGVPCR